MTFFTTDSSKKSSNNFEPVPQGWYEVIVSEVTKATGSNAFKSGSEGLKLVYTIRGDVEQECGNRKLFDNLVASANSMWRWNDIAAATLMPDGQAFASAEEVINAFGKHLSGKPLKVYVKHEDYQGKTQERVSGFDVSDHGAAATSNVFDASQYSDPFSDDGKPLDISDDDLPF